MSDRVTSQGSPGPPSALPHPAEVSLLTLVQAPAMAPHPHHTGPALSVLTTSPSLSHSRLGPPSHPQHPISLAPRPPAGARAQHPPCRPPEPRRPCTAPRGPFSHPGPRLQLRSLPAPQRPASGPKAHVPTLTFATDTAQRPPHPGSCLPVPRGDPSTSPPPEKTGRKEDAIVQPSKPHPQGANPRF